jgi:AbrB family looped-hinge helix DNA binding protein
VRNHEAELTTISRKGQVVIPQAVRKKLGIRPKTRFLVYGEGDTVLLRRVELPDIREEWKSLKELVQKRLEMYGSITEEEIEATVRKYRHRKRQSS